MNRLDFVEKAQIKENIPAFQPGDTLRVHVRIQEGKVVLPPSFAAPIRGRGRTPCQGGTRLRRPNVRTQSAMISVDQAVERMAKAKPDDHGMEQLRVEAAHLLGLPES